MPFCCKYPLGQRRGLVTGRGPPSAIRLAISCYLACVLRAAPPPLVHRLPSGCVQPCWAGTLGLGPRLQSQTGCAPPRGSAPWLCEERRRNVEAWGGAGRGRTVSSARWHLSSPSSALPPAPPALGPRSLLTRSLASPSIPHTAAADLNRIGPCHPCTNPGSDFP